MNWLATRSVRLTLCIFLCCVAWGRLNQMAERTQDLQIERANWEKNAAAAAAWLASPEAKPGAVALQDIGYIGWVTDRTIIDTVGLVDRDVSHLLGGYGTKTQGLSDRVFDRAPAYVVLASSAGDCLHTFHPTDDAVYADPRLQERYRVAKQIGLGFGVSWCIWEAN